MTATDAARLSLALLTGEPPSAVVKEFEFFRILQCANAVPEDTVTETDQLREGHTIEELLIALIDALGSLGWQQRHCEPFLDGFLTPEITISVDAARREAAVSLPKFSGEYLDLAGQDELVRLSSIRPVDYAIWKTMTAIEDYAKPKGRGMRVVRTITTTEILPLAMAISGNDLTTDIDPKERERANTIEQKVNS